MIVAAESDMGRTLALLLMLPPLAVVPVAIVVALLGNWAASVRLITSEAIFLATFAVPLAFLVQCTYGVLCFTVLRRLRILNFWSCLLAGSLPFVAGNLAGYIEEPRVTLIVGGFGLAVALASWAVLRVRGELS